MTDSFALKSWVIDFVGKVLKKASSNNIYSTEEKKIGTWVNGKPIYRIVSDDKNFITTSITSDSSKSSLTGTNLMVDMFSYTNSKSTPLRVYESTLQVYTNTGSNQGVIAIYNNDTLVAKKENLPSITTASFTIPAFELSSGATMTIKMGFTGRHNGVEQRITGNIGVTQNDIDEILKTENVSGKFVFEYTKSADKATT